MSEYRLISLGAASLAGIGSFLLLMGLGLIVLAVWEKVRELRVPRRVRLLISMYQQQGVSYRGEIPDDVLYGLPPIPWNSVAVVVMAFGGLLGILVMGFTLGMVGLGLGGGVILLRRLLLGQGKERLQRSVRDFADDLRVAVDLWGSLGLALNFLAEFVERQRRRDAVALVLRRYPSQRTQDMSPDEVVRRMARDLRSPEMEHMARQLEAALESGLPLQEALARISSTLSDRIQANVLTRLEAAPNTYIIPMGITMFGPLLILILYPLTVRILSVLQF